jgi:hypothetical protein
MGGSPEIWPLTDLAAAGPGSLRLPGRVLTASYPVTAADSGQALSFNSASAVTMTLLSSVPSADWFIFVENVGTGALTVARNGRTIDASAGDLTLLKDQGCLIYTDGADYLTNRGISGSGGGGVLADELSARPAAGTANRIFIPIDQPIGQPDFYWDSGTAWIPFVNFRPLYPPVGGQQYLSILTIFGGNHV